MDSLLPQHNNSLSESSSRVVNALLSALDSVKNHNGIYVIAATNRPDLVDPAMLTPGRFEKVIFIGLPDADQRLEILMTLTKNTTLLNVDLRAVAGDPRCADFRLVLLNTSSLRLFIANIILVVRV